MTNVIPLPGDYGLTQISGNVGRLIRVGQWLCGTGFANYEHAFVYIGGGQIVEAEPGGARIRPVTEYANICWSTGHFPLTPKQRDIIVDRARVFAADKTPYSFLDYAAIAAHRLDLPLPFLRQYVESTKHVICSQLVDTCYHAAGPDLHDGEWPGYVTPEDLYNLLGRDCG